MADEDGVAVIDELDVEDNDVCPGHDWNDVGVILPLNFVVGVSEGPMGLMAKVVDVCLVVDPDGILEDADPDDEALPDGCTG